MLQITGNVLDVTQETIGEGQQSFVSTTIHMLAGEGAATSLERVRVARDFKAEDWPKKGELRVTLNVVVSAYATRNGAGYRLTALGKVSGQRVAAAS